MIEDVIEAAKMTEKASNDAVWGQKSDGVEKVTLLCAIFKPNYMKLTTNPRVLLVENESQASVQLGNVIKQAGLTPLGPITSVETAKAIYQEVHPPLIFVNVQLDGSIDGIELACELMALGASSQLRQLPMLVFTTDTTDQQAFTRACALRPLAYLEKPYQPASLQHVLQMARTRTEPVTTSLVTEEQQMAIMPATLVSQPESLGLGCLFVREGGRLVRLDPADITCVHMEDKYCVIVTGTGRRHSVRVPLADLLRQLGLNDFVRIHRSWLVNVNRIEYIDPVESVVHLTGGTEAPVGRSFRNELFSVLPMLE
jgi:DNA-binding LytR/AlgR family response regulator